MKLVSFSVENYRSITAARKIPLSKYSLLVGPNIEGKSNILHALALGMGTLVSWHRQIRRTVDGKILRIHPSLLHGDYGYPQYNWRVDFPIIKQARANENSKTSITLEFTLDEEEVVLFRNEIGSNLNGTLPILFEFGQSSFDVSVQKPGKGYATLNKKSTRIANFVSRRIKFEYIPPVRTASSAGEVINKLVEQVLRNLEEDAEYAAAFDKIEALQKPLFEDLATSIKSTVSNFLPSIKTVRLEVKRDAHYRALRREVNILVNDGQETMLERKGDGVQSLVALALMQYASQQRSTEATTVIAIEEPESHLHPNAVHELRKVIEELSTSNQIVLSSHSPLFVNPSHVHNTIVVKDSRAKSARHISEIREALGVRFSDNLYNASHVLLVEGPDDIIALKAIVKFKSIIVRDALENGSVVFDHLGGASGLSSKASFYKASACQVQCFLDNDREGRNAVDKAMTLRTVKITEVNLCTVPHLEDSELEDIYDKDTYRERFINEFGVDPKSKPKGKPRLKWSGVMERLFRESGKPWNDAVKANVKNWLAEFAANSPEQIVREELQQPLLNFVAAVESKIKV